MIQLRIRPLLALALSAGASLACSSGSVNIGNTNAIGSQLSDYAATWDGYAEAYTFLPDGSDRVRLTIGADGQGTVEVGDTALLPAPTDPNVGYPSAGLPSPATFNPGAGLTGGALYPIYAARVEESRIQAGLKPNDYYGAWCALQTPYYVLMGYTSTGAVAPDGGSGGASDGGLAPNYGYSCVPGAGGGFSGTGADQQCFTQSDSVDGGYTNTQVDCGKFSLCSYGTCACTATSCGSAPTVAADAIPSAYPAELDAALDSTGRTLTGTLALSTTRVTVVLTKK